MSNLPISVDFKSLRKKRQAANVHEVYQCLHEGDEASLTKCANPIELERYLEHMNWSKNQLFLICKDNMMCMTVAFIIAKKASRQGSLDEIEQINICSITAAKYGVAINKLSGFAKRPAKNGKIISNEFMRINKIPKDSCLKSFDAEITGKMTGYISAKVVFGSGGHQDNVFEEMDTLCLWWKEYKSESDEFLVILLDSDLKAKITKIKAKYSYVHNVKIFNHIEFQQYIIDSYYI